MPQTKRNPAVSRTRPVRLGTEQKTSETLLKRPGNSRHAVRTACCERHQAPSLGEPKHVPPISAASVQPELSSRGALGTWSCGTARRNPRPRLFSRQYHQVVARRPVRAQHQLPGFRGWGAQIVLIRHRRSKASHRKAKSEDRLHRLWELCKWKEGSAARFRAGNESSPSCTCTRSYLSSAGEKPCTSHIGKPPSSTELAAQAHRTAAEHNEKGDDKAADWHLERALEFSDHAYKVAREAHSKSGRQGSL